MTKAPKVARTLATLDKVLGPWRRRGDTIALVPTMGALHRGHVALVEAAQKRAKRVVVSIFVNPTQFAPHEDFGTYPRTWKADIAALTAAGADAVWAPSAAVMYPEGFSTHISPGGPALAGLEDKFRPHFFGGVATVVTKLLTQVRPDIAVFGEKDYQQLQVVTQLARDLDLRTKVVGLKTVREKDGLALSSRNAYLSETERKAAPTLQRVLRDCAASIRRGRPITEALTEGRRAIIGARFALDYLEARHAETLAQVSVKADGPIRLLVAAKLGKTRLIDNLAV